MNTTGNNARGSRVTIDWLQFTMPHDLRPKDVLPENPCFDIVARTRPLKQYQLAYVLECGGIVNIASERVEHMGINMLFSGQPLRNIRQCGITDDDLVWWSTSIARKFSRVDVALDVPFQMSPRKIRDDSKRGKIKTQMKFYDLIEMGEDGAQGGGVYFGSPRSHRRVNIYDKAKQLGLLSDALTRVEMRMANRNASNAIRAMKDLGVSRGGRATMKKYFDYNTAWFQDAMSDLEEIVLPEAEPKPDGWIRWVLNDVVKSCEKRKDTHKDTIETLINRLSGLLDT